MKARPIPKQEAQTLTKQDDLDSQRMLRLTMHLPPFALRALLKFSKEDKCTESFLISRVLMEYLVSRSKAGKEPCYTRE